MNFFVLKNQRSENGGDVTDYLPVDGSATGDAKRCHLCGRFLEMLPLLPPLLVELEAWGARWGDVVFGPNDQLLISDKLKKLFAGSNLYGFVRFDNVDVVKTRIHSFEIQGPPDYWLASIARSRAAIDEVASGLVRDEEATCNECRNGGIINRIERVMFQSDTWSGEDVFFAHGLPGTIFVSERFVQLCGTNCLANCSFIEAENFSFNDYSWEI